MPGPKDPDRIPLDLDVAAACDADARGELGYCLVTGGAGYLGRHLVFELLGRGHHVRAFDRAPIPYRHERLDVAVGDVREFEDVRKACEGVDTVFHTAACLSFQTFPTREQRDETFAVNVAGVENALRACVEAGVSRLVHTSSNNVTFDGPVIDGDETRPYADGVRDIYTRTKILGEKAALAANGRGGLLTCAIRPGGIYGPGERLLFPRVVEECASGRYLAIVGDGSALSDNTYIENLVDGHIEAARHLVPGSALCGQAYFITDGAPINYFEFFRPIVTALGFRHPKLAIPAAPLLGLAWVWEWLHRALRVPPPFLTHLEVRKVAISHYNRIDKARRDFGWTPPVDAREAARRCIPYCEKLLAEREGVDRPHWAWWIALPAGMLALGILTLDAGAHAWWSESVTSWTPRWLLAGILGWALLLHVYKGMKAVRMAERAGLRASSMGWGWQSFALGFASLALLEKRIARLREADGGAPGDESARRMPPG